MCSHDSGVSTSLVGTGSLPLQECTAPASRTSTARQGDPSDAGGEAESVQRRRGAARCVRRGRQREREAPAREPSYLSEPPSRRVRIVARRRSSTKNGGGANSGGCPCPRRRRARPQPGQSPVWRRAR
eukprot:scaffold7424_cov417-Prasinococcus_capsulatus_cf.AAC.2